MEIKTLNYESLVFFSFFILCQIKISEASLGFDVKMVKKKKKKK